MFIVTISSKSNCVCSHLKGPKSVTVWIHGGTFLNGGAPSYTPSELVTEDDVILVVIQYRLDVLGFLSSGDDTVPGNYGLWDQNLALREGQYRGFRRGPRVHDRLRGVRLGRPVLASIC